MHNDKSIIEIVHGTTKCLYFNKYYCPHFPQCGNWILRWCLELFYLLPDSLQVLFQLFILWRQVLNILSCFSRIGQVVLGNGGWMLLGVWNYHPFLDECRWCVVIPKFLPLHLYNLLLQLVKWYIVHIHDQIIIKDNNISLLIREWFWHWR